jgi:hypothetical protein
MSVPRMGRRGPLDEAAGFHAAGRAVHRDRRDLAAARQLGGRQPAVVAQDGQRRLLRDGNAGLAQLRRSDID